ncbi:ATP-dependent 6-phosphofructokinase [Haloferula sp. BvORR071]|uniref:ATP-dependent 6-phosphofructokinase n=1 Tax=Haloferula sp. BvORR071 TaxID=1396141 RepID=UPI000552D90B|nr:ATP-dependent 6-phosphofructokinase [Haloferula sp. BvORR071]
MDTPSLGPAHFASGLRHTIGDEVRIPERIESGREPGLMFEVAGPRGKLFFDPKKTRAGIVTCGGLCPGLNNVIRSLFLELYHGYGVTEVLGFRGGYAGLDPANATEPVAITPEFVEGIHRKGGTILGTSRGPVDIGRAVDNLIARGVDILFTVGGDGTQKGANALYQEASRRGHSLAVVGVPKTIDNDVAFVARTFGFFSAVEEAVKVLDRAHTEACSTPGGIGLVKLMGRHAGFITVGATVASQDVNFLLIPEVPFKLEAFLAALEERMRNKSHAVIAVAEGAGQELLRAQADQHDASGNTKLSDIGVFLRERIENHFKAVGLPVVMRYFDPSYLVRSSAANCEDALLCDLFARNAVHAAMAGKTGVVIGFLHERFIHVPIELIAGRSKRIDPDGGWWHSALATTGQPERFE